MVNKNNILPIIFGSTLFFLSFTSGTWVFVNENKKVENMNNFVPSITASNYTQTITREILNTSIPPFKLVITDTVIPLTTALPEKTQIPQKIKISQTPRVIKTPVPSTTPVPTFKITSTPIPIVPQTTAAPAYFYNNGSYTDTGSYYVADAGGNESIKIQITLTNDVITSVQATPEATNPDSYNYQQNFSDGISSKVVGLKLQNAGNISRVNGASLTTEYFNNTIIPNIQNQAKH